MGGSREAPLYHLMRDRFQLKADLDLCAVVYGPPPLSRSKLAALAPLVAEAAREGDSGARGLFEQAALHLAAIVHAVHDQLHIPHGTTDSGVLLGWHVQAHGSRAASVRSGA